MDARAHVLDMDVDQPRRPAADYGVNGAFGLAMKMADVQREAEAVHTRLGEQFFPTGHRIDVHARLRLEADRDASCGSVVERFAKALGEPIHGRCAANAVAQPAGPDRDAIAAQRRPYRRRICRIRSSACVLPVRR